MWLLVAAIAITVLTISRFYLMVKFKWVGSDSFYLLTSGELIRVNRSLKFVNDRFVMPEQFDYPPLVPILVSKFPVRHLRHAQWMGPIADVLSAAVVAAMAFWIGGYPAGVVALLVYATTPAAFNDSYMLSSRAMGNLFLNMTAAALLLTFLGYWPFGWLVAGICGCMVLLSHRLTAQSLLACLLGASLFNPLPVLGTVLVAGLLPILLTRGWYLKSLKGHIKFLVDLHKNGNERAHPLGNLIALAKRNPHVLALIVLVAYPSIQFDEAEVWLLVCILMVFILSIAWPLGAGARHFGNASGLVAIATALLTVESHIYIPVAVTSIAAGTIVMSKLTTYPKAAAKGASTLVTRSVLESCNFLRNSHASEKEDLVVLSWPLSLSYQVMYLAHAWMVAASGGTGSGLLYNYDLKERIEKSGLETLTGREVPTHVLHHQATSLQIDRTEWQEIFSSGEVKVYKNRAICGSR